jgi:plastocyanin
MRQRLWPGELLGAIGLAVLLLAGCNEMSDGKGSSKAGMQAIEEGKSSSEAAMPAMESDHGTTTPTQQDTPAAAAPNQIVIDNFTFNPSTLTITAGTQVTWVNHDDVPHTVTHSVKPRQFDSGTMDTDAQFSHKFMTPGTYDYFCALHPRMTAKIIVK